jgi:hypothetical protein
MKQDLSKITDKLAGFTHLLGRFRVILFVIIVAVLYSFLIVEIAQLSQIQPDPDAVEDQLQRSAGPRLDRQAITAIEQLQDQNIQVETLFREARENPFSE